MFVHGTKQGTIPIPRRHRGSTCNQPVTRPLPNHSAGYNYYPTPQNRQIERNSATPANQPVRHAAEGQRRCQRPQTIAAYRATKHTGQTTLARNGICTIHDARRVTAPTRHVYTRSSCVRPLTSVASSMTPPERVNFAITGRMRRTGCADPTCTDGVDEALQPAEIHPQPPSNSCCHCSGSWLLLQLNSQTTASRSTTAATELETSCATPPQALQLESTETTTCFQCGSGTVWRAHVPDGTHPAHMLRDCPCAGI